jgi:hypothetical protein
MTMWLRALALLCITSGTLAAQELVVRRADGTEGRLLAAELSALPRHRLDAMEHGTPIRYEGTTLASVLVAADAGPVDSLRGSLLRRIVLLVGQDGYAAAVALAEIDRTLGARTMLIADHANDAPLAVTAGPLRAVMGGDGRPARSVRQLVRIEVRDVDTPRP